MKRIITQEDVMNVVSLLGVNHKQKGDEIELERCPYCQSTGSGDRYTSSINIKSGLFNCLRSSCGEKKNLFQIDRDFDLQALRVEEVKYTTYKQSKIKPKPNESAHKYLKSRGISNRIADKYYITESAKHKDILMFPHYDQYNILKCIKLRYISKGAEIKERFKDKDTELILFGMYQCDPSVDKTLIITEGQIDALSVAESGFTNVVSVPNGCQGWTWLNGYCRDWIIDNFDKLVVFGDFEHNQRTLVDKLSSLPMKDGVYAVRKSHYLGCKDANEILMNYSVIDVQKAIDEAELLSPNNYIYASDVIEIDDTKVEKVLSAIPALDRALGGFKYGTLNIISGRRGKGKSTFASQIVCELMEQSVPTFVYSGELSNARFMNTLNRQMAGKENIKTFRDKLTGADEYKTEPEVITYINNQINEKLILWRDDGDDMFDIVPKPDETGELEKVISRYHVRAIVIDNLMSCSDYSSSDIYNKQTTVLQNLARLCRKMMVIIFLVVHPRKVGGTYITIDDIAGSANIGNLVDVVMTYEKEDDNSGKIQLLKNREKGIELRSSSEESEDKSIHVVYDQISKRITPQNNQNKKYSAIEEYERDLIKNANNTI